MTQMQNIALLLFAADALVLLALVLRIGSRRASYGPAGRVDGDVQRLTRELTDWADEIDRKIDTRLAELRDLTAQAQAAADQLAERPRQGDVSHKMPIVTDSDRDIQSPPNKLPDPLKSATYASHAEVRRLSDSGLRPLAIARRLGRPLGEVELIIKLASGLQKVTTLDEPANGAAIPARND